MKTQIVAPTGLWAPGAHLWDRVEFAEKVLVRHSSEVFVNADRDRAELPPVELVRDMTHHRRAIRIYLQTKGANHIYLFTPHDAGEWVVEIQLWEREEVRRWRKAIKDKVRAMPTRDNVTPPPSLVVLGEVP